ncbi:MAG TPA: polyketide synthase dehydratase domain-containing protein, partial [Burkholderiaceae bacterium]|nr:polyketide synthase dehydratase domain-containing protein [Burkholderiaceae bacterium]
MLVALYLAGHKINWSAVHADAPRRRIPLPTYPFQRQRHWVEDNTTTGDRSRSAVEPAPHPLVGALVERSAGEARYEARYGTKQTNYFSDHRISGTVVLPTTAALEAATVLGRLHFGTHQVSFDNVMHHRAMSFSNSEERIVRLVVTPLRSDRANFRLLSAARGDAEVWQTHMTGNLRKSGAQAPPTFSLRDVQARCGRTIPVADFYDRLNSLGLEYGPGFRGVRQLRIGEHEALARVQLPQHLAAAHYTLHPAFLDACLHAYPMLLYGADNTEHSAGSCYLPVSVTGFRCYRDGVEEAWAHITHRGVEQDGTQVVDIRVYDVTGRLVAELEGLALRELSLDTLLPSRADADHLFYRAAWRKSIRRPARSRKDSEPASWIIFADAKGVGDALA